MRLLSVFRYPKPRRAAVREVLHGVEIADPYQWMEDPNSNETKTFVQQQNAISKPFVNDNCAPRSAMKAALRVVHDYEKITAPEKIGDYYYYEYNSGLQNQSILYRKNSLYDKSAEVFLDPSTLSDDGTVSLTSLYPSKDGQYYAYLVAKSGSDWNSIHVRRTANKQDLPEKIEGLRHSNMAWTHDEKGFFYGQYPNWKDEEVSGTASRDAENQKIYYHRLGTEQSDDILVAEFPDHPRWLSYVFVSDCGTKLILSVTPNSVTELIYVTDISSGIERLPSFSLIKGSLASKFSYIANDGDTYYFLTNSNRPNRAVVKLNINKPEQWEDVIPEDPKRVLTSVSAIGRNKLVANYIEDVASVIEVYNMKGELLQKLPFEKGSIKRTIGDRKRSEVFFEFVSFANPMIVYRADVDDTPAAKLVEYKRTKLNSWSTDDLSYKQVFFKSADNTSVPMYILHRSDRQPNPSTPALLYAYGGFGVSLAPHFSLFNLMLVYTLGFVVSIANVRGGGEYGQQWHDAGRLEHKQNTLDDIHAAARFLIDNNFTSAANLTLTGRSNGGFVTLASINQRPELFGAAIAGVPVADLLRFHKFTVGHSWVSDFGNPDNASHFAYTRSVSPLHNIPQSLKKYPALLIQTADHDDRVVPSHSLKFIAELQHRAQEQADLKSTLRSVTVRRETEAEKELLFGKNLRPFLALIDTNAGHGSGKPTRKRIDDIADRMCFLKNALELNYDGSKFRRAIDNERT